jgi:hypothetical protein
MVHALCLQRCVPSCFTILCPRAQTDGQGQNIISRHWILSLTIQRAFENKQGGQTSKSDGPAKAKKSSHCVSLADKCPIHSDGTHMWGDCYQNIVNKDKKFPTKGFKLKGKTTSTHEANLIYIEPAEKATDCAPLLITAKRKRTLWR